MRIKLIAGGSTSLSLISSTKNLSIRLSKIQKKQGVKGLALFLKSSSVSLQQSVSGYIIKDLSEVGPRVSRTCSGLPRIIPARHRIIIHNRAPGYLILIRFYLSIFYLYRVLEFQGKVKLETITKPGVEFDMSRFQSKIELFNILMKRGRKSLSDPLSYMKSKFKFFPIFKSSPLTSAFTTVPFKNRLKAYSVWSTHLFPLLDTWRAMRCSSVSEYARVIYNSLYFNRLDLRLHWLPKGIGNTQVESEKLGFKFNIWSRLPLGKLSLKKEAAGKVRVFAMVDPITQWLLAPLHKYLFSILRGIPMDGTFNQLKPVYRLLRSSGIRSYFSLDLSAATDRLPLSIQALLLDNLIPTSYRFGQVWAKLLVDRDYVLKSEEFGISDSFRYAVGQPMGALSSWAMLAYSHHFIVQVAAWECGHPQYKLFSSYAVLGDDLVIADWKVAKRYLSILKDIGVECGLHKSILSHKGQGIEFAKNTFVDGVNVSPISFKELEVAHKDLSAWAAFINKFGLTWDRQCRVLGHGYLARRKSFSKLNHALQLVYLSQVVKSDFNTDTLRLRKGAPKDFNTRYLTLFNEDVLFPCLKLLRSRDEKLIKFRDETQRYILSDWNFKSGFSNPFEAKAFWLEVWEGGTSSIWKELEPMISELSKFRTAVKSMKKWKAYPTNWDKGFETPTFDGALKLYLKAQRMLALFSKDPYEINSPKKVKRLEGKLPYQVRIFRNWSRLVHKAVRSLRRNKTP